VDARFSVSFMLVVSCAPGRSLLSMIALSLLYCSVVRSVETRTVAHPYSNEFGMETKSAGVRLE